MLTVQEHKAIREAMAKECKVKKFNKQDVERIVKASVTGNWKDVYKSDLYLFHGGQYCTLQWVMSVLRNEGIIKYPENV